MISDQDVACYRRGGHLAVPDVLSADELADELADRQRVTDVHEHQRDLATRFFQHPVDDAVLAS